MKDGDCGCNGDGGGPIEIEEDGRIEVKINGAIATIDLLHANTKLSRISAEHGNDLEKLYEAVVAYLAELGFVDCSHLTAYRFMAKVFELAGPLLKKFEPATAGNAG